MGGPPPPHPPHPSAPAPAFSGGIRLTEARPRAPALGAPGAGRQAPGARRQPPGARQAPGASVRVASAPASSFAPGVGASVGATARRGVRHESVTQMIILLYIMS